MCISTLQERHSYLRDAQKIEKTLQDSIITYLRYDNRIEDNMFSRYYILDLDEGQRRDDIYSFIKSKEKFDLLQNTMLADDFYNCSDDLRFNLYLVILTNRLSSIENLRDIQCDYNYGRKLVFNETLANIYFDSFDCVSTQRRPDDKLRRNNNSEFVKNLASVERTLIKKTSELSMNSYMQTRIFSDLIPSLKKKDFSVTLIPYLFRNKKKEFYFEKYMRLSKDRIDYWSFLHESAHFMDEQIILSNGIKKSKSTRKSFPAINDASILDYIDEMTIAGYKNFTSPQSLRFSRVNLLCGENGSGKTTIINSIKSALTGSFDGEDTSHEICVSGKAKNGKSMQFCNENVDFDGYAQLWYNVSKNDLARYFDKYNYFDGGRALDFALNDLDIADLFIDTSVNRVIRDLYDRKKFFAHQVEHTLESIEHDNIKARLPEPTEAKKKLETEGIELREIQDGIFHVELTKPFERYSKSLQRAINSIRYQNLIKLKENMQQDLDVEKERDISNIIMKDLGIYDRIRALFLLLTSARDYSDIQSGEQHSLAAVKINSNIPILPANMSTGQRVCFALAALLASFLENSKAPNIIILDEPVANLDDIHLLNMLDILRQLAINGTQVFFTTANESVAKLFMMKFGFMKDKLRSIKVSDVGDKVIVSDFGDF